MKSSEQNWSFWLLVALAVVVIAFLSVATILAKTANDKVGEFDAGKAAGGLTGGLLSLLKR